MGSKSDKFWHLDALSARLDNIRKAELENSEKLDYLLALYKYVSFLEAQSFVIQNIIYNPVLNNKMQKRDMINNCRALTTHLHK